jgi:hypothetical protein
MPHLASMKKKIIITLSSDVLARVDLIAGSKLSRSAVIERTLRLHFKAVASRRIYARDLARINAAAARLNSEAEDVLSYQAGNA